MADHPRSIVAQQLRKGQIFKRFFAALPAYGVQDWSLAECERIKQSLKPCWKQHKLRDLFMERIEERKRELRKVGTNEARECDG